MKRIIKKYLNFPYNRICNKLKRYPVKIIAKVTTPKNIKINFSFIALLKIIASGKLNAAVAIMKAKAVPKGTPF